ncbi:acyl-CoA thioesterase [Gilvimarinus chinensis]|uniref:acyl-CoA thioesterase n=1 Tax=Gilvimarinus chinensis TaxID=396005 RepID=UPI00037E80DD|nr:acyl-CoA thioesterase [Gilvimarinus chinensis]
MAEQKVIVTQTVKVPFYDVDSMGIVWHGHYIKYFEDARCALLDAIDYNYESMSASGYGFPVVDLHLKYVKPARFNRLLKVEATLEEWEVRLKIRYRIIDLHSGDILTKGHSVQVAVSVDDGEMCFATPPILAEKVLTYLGKVGDA